MYKRCVDKNELYAQQETEKNHANLKCKPALTEKQTESQVAETDLAHPCSPVCSCLTSTSAIVAFSRPAGKSLLKNHQASPGSVAWEPRRRSSRSISFKRRSR